MTCPRSVRSSASRPERALLGALAAACAVLAAGAVQAGTPSCTISTAAVAFGAYEAVSASEAAGYVDVACGCSVLNDCVDLPYQLEIQPGASNSIGPRRMVRGGGTETLDYELYKDSGRTALWGTGADALGGTFAAAQFEGSDRIHVYGRIPAGQHVPPGSYGETPTVVMTY